MGLRSLLVLISMTHLHSKIYSNKFISHFKGDKSGNLGTRQTPGMLYSKAIPTPVAKPTLLAWSEELANELEIDPPTQQDIDILGGNLVTPTMFPYAACYAGHQFGNWAGQLGDGRAITLGEWETSNGKSYELQLKGAGPTPYSRRADGRAVLRSSLREYMMSLYPDGNELLYHTHALTSVFCISEKLGDAYCMIPIYTNHLNLGFNKGTLLKDPHQLLSGTGNLIRHIPIKQPSDYRNAKVEALIKEAIAFALKDMDKPSKSVGKVISKITKRS